MGCGTPGARVVRVVSVTSVVAVVVVGAVVMAGVAGVVVVAGVVAVVAVVVVGAVVVVAVVVVVVGVVVVVVEVVIVVVCGSGVWVRLLLCVGPPPSVDVPATDALIEFDVLKLILELSVPRSIVGVSLRVRDALIPLVSVAVTELEWRLMECVCDCECGAVFVVSGVAVRLIMNVFEGDSVAGRDRVGVAALCDVVGVGGIGMIVYRGCPHCNGNGSISSTVRSVALKVLGENTISA